MAVASMAWQADAVQRALSVWAEEVRPLAGSMTFRVICARPWRGPVPAERPAAGDDGRHQPGQAALEGS